MSDACCGPRDSTDDDTADAPERLWQITEIRLAAAAGLLLGAAFILSVSTDTPTAVLAIQIGALVIAASTFVPSTLRGLLKGRIDVGTLMTIAAVGAVALGEMGEAAMLAFLFAIAEGLEEYAVARTRRGLRSLLRLIPDTAVVRRGGHDTEVRSAELAPGDIMVIRPGDRLATDGVISQGATSVNNSAITGESMPVEVTTGDEVFAGAINGAGAVEVRVTAGAQDNSLARIVRIVEQEQSRKGATQRLADRIARPLVPGIMITAALIAGIGSLLGDPRLWIERALVVLVAASPCALAISVPVTVVAAVGAATKFGVLIKGGDALERLGRVRTVALDKTGTLTRNDPVVIAVVAATGVGEHEVLAAAAALESRSEHPLAQAILTAYPDHQTADEVTAVVGSGLTGALGGRRLRLGRPGWIDPGPLREEVTSLQAGGATTVLVERDGAVIGAIAVRDELRVEAAGVVADLRRHGYGVAILTGDNERTARSLADAAGIDDVHFELRPEGKATIVRGLRSSHPTAMVGDGVNDAPALATADLGIAMGAMGTDVAIETADVALMAEDLRALPQALTHGRRTRTIMLQNLGLSIAIIVVLMPLALLGTLGLAAVVLVHEVAELLVILNGIRAGRRPVRRPAPDHVTVSKKLA